MSLHHKKHNATHDTEHVSRSFATGLEEDVCDDHGLDEAFYAEVDNDMDDESDAQYQADLSWIEQADSDNYHNAAQALAWLDESNDINPEYRSAQTAPASTLFDEPTDPAAIRSVVSSISQMIPAIIRAVGQHPEARDIFEAEAGMSFEQIDPDDSEVWPAIIGAIASAVPAIVGAVSQAVQSGKRQRRHAQPRSNSRSQQRPCPQASRHEQSQDIEAAEAIQLAALIPILVQLLPVIIPLINQIIPLLTKSLPTLLNSFGKMAAGAKRPAKESVYDSAYDGYGNSDESYDEEGNYVEQSCQSDTILTGAADIDAAAEDLP
jgi:hypothetical protein